VGDQIEKNAMSGRVALWGSGGVYRILVGKPEEKRPIGRPMCRCKYNIKTDLQEMVWGQVDWIDLTQDRDR
jgi:hypothetical protein